MAGEVRRSWHEALRWGRGVRTQSDVASVVAWNRSRLSNYEGARRQPSVDDLVDWHQALSNLEGTRVHRLQLTLDDVVLFAELAARTPTPPHRPIWIDEENWRMEALSMAWLRRKAP